MTKNDKKGQKMDKNQVCTKMTKLFHKQMIQSPAVPLNIAFYQDLLKNVANKFAEEFSNEDTADIEDATAKIAEEFVWFEVGTELDGTGGGYYKNINNPKKLYGKGLYKVLNIENNKKEQEMADKLYGTGE